MEDKELKKKLAKIPDADENGDPIYKITTTETSARQSKNKTRDAEKRGAR